MNSQTSNSIPANNIIPNPSNEFEHYALSAEKMEKAAVFFDRFFILNIIKLVIYFLAMPASLGVYSAGSISAYLLLTAVEISCLITTSYKDIYLKNFNKSKIAAVLMLAADLGFFLFKSGALFSSPTHYLVILSAIASVKAILKLGDIEKLSHLKGYPNFSEITDNPNYVPNKPLPFPYNINHIPSKNTARANPNVQINIPVNASMPSLQTPNHVSVHMPDISIEKEPAVNISHDRNDIPNRLSENDIFPIPPACYTPSEARLIGNATMNTATAMTEELYIPPKTHKKINLSKKKEGNSQ